MLNPAKLLLIALIWFCKSTSLPKLYYNARFTQQIRNSGLKWNQNAAKTFFLFFFSLHLNLRVKIPKFQIEREPDCSEDLFLELTRHFIPCTPSKLGEGALLATNPIMKENYSFFVCNKSNKNIVTEGICWEELKLPKRSKIEKTAF